jgi:hypothetical protein
MADVWCVRGYIHEVEPPIEEDCPMCEAEDRIKLAGVLLREWRDKHGGQEMYKVRNFGTLTGASPTDLLRDTQRFLEGK